MDKPTAATAATWVAHDETTPGVDLANLATQTPKSRSHIEHKQSAAAT